MPCGIRPVFVSPPVGLGRCCCADFLLTRPRLGWTHHTLQLQQVQEQLSQVHTAATSSISVLGRRMRATGVIYISCGSIGGEKKEPFHFVIHFLILYKLNNTLMLLVLRGNIINTYVHDIFLTYTTNSISINILLITVRQTRLRLTRIRFLRFKGGEKV